VTELPDADVEVQTRSLRKLRVILGVVGLLVIAASLVLLIWGDDLLLAATAGHFVTAPAAASASRPNDRAEADRQDLDALDQFATLDAGLTDQTRAAFETERQAIAAHAGTLTPPQLALGVAKAVARAGNRASRVDFAGNPAIFNRLPIRLERFVEGVFIVAAQGPAVPLLGAKVETIGGKDLDELSAAYRPFAGGGTDSGRQAAGLWFLESPSALNAVGLLPSPADAVLQVTLPDGTAQSVTLAAIPGDAAARPEGWKELLGTARPLSLRELGRAFYGQAVADGLYLRLDRVEDDEHGPIGQQFAAPLSHFGPGSLRWAVLDLRRTASGSYTRIGRPLRNLPSLVPESGHVFVLTGPRTVGPGMIIASWTKALLGSRAIIEGEPVGDTLQFWSQEGPPLVLPNSGIVVDFATAYHDLEHGCGGLSCYWPDKVYGVAAGSLAPSVMVHWRFDDYRQGIDPILARLADMTRSRELAAKSP